MLKNGDILDVDYRLELISLCSWRTQLVKLTLLGTSIRYERIDTLKYMQDMKSGLKIVDSVFNK